MVKRGSVYYAALEGNKSIQGGKRPVVVISNELNNVNAPTVNVIPLTSKIKALHLPCHVLISSTEKLKVDSMALCEQIITINKDNLGEEIAVLGSEIMTKIESAIDKQFGKSQAEYEYIELLKMDMRLTTNPIEKAFMRKLIAIHCKRFGICNKDVDVFEQLRLKIAR